MKLFLFVGIILLLYFVKYFFIGWGYRLKKFMIFELRMLGRKLLKVMCCIFVMIIFFDFWKSFLLFYFGFWNLSFLVM